MDDKDSLVQQFCGISGVDAERAKFYLESAAWNLETALGSFYEGEDDTGSRNSNIEEPAPPEEIEVSPPETDIPSMPRVRMMDEDDDSSEGEEQAFYAGGSEHSGQQVLGPRKKKDVISKLFKSAKEHGAEVLEGSDPKKDKKSTFKGTGYRLGETEDDTEVIPGRAEPQSPRDVILRMWRTGFSVDDGPLRKYEDPENAEFLNAVRRGEIPLELIKQARGGEVYLNMEDHRHEDFVAPRGKREYFTGSGQTLGSPAPNVVGQVTHTGFPGGASGNTALASTPTATKDPKDINVEAQKTINVDSSLPTTNIQVRHPDGSRLVLKLNHDNTIGNIRIAILAAYPQLHVTPFAVMTTFPFAELTNDDQKIKEANLLNAALVVKLK